MRLFFQILKLGYRYISTFVVMAHYHLSRNPQRIIVHSLFITVLYVSAHLALSRTSYYVCHREYNRPLGAKTYTHLPLRIDHIYSSYSLTTLESSLNLFFLPVAFIDYCLTGFAPCERPTLKLTIE